MVKLSNVKTSKHVMDCDRNFNTMTGRLALKIPYVLLNLDWINLD